MRGRGREGVPDTSQVHINYVSPQFRRGVVPPTNGGHAGVGADDVDATERLSRLGQHRLNVSALAHVCNSGEGAASSGLNAGKGFIEISAGGKRVAHRINVAAEVDQDDVGALFGQAQRVVTALTTGASGDEGDLPFYTSHSRCLLRPHGSASVVVRLAPTNSERPKR